MNAGNREGAAAARAAAVEKLIVDLHRELDAIGEMTGPAPASFAGWLLNEWGPDAGAMPVWRLLAELRAWQVWKDERLLSDVSGPLSESGQETGDQGPETAPEGGAS